MDWITETRRAGTTLESAYDRSRMLGTVPGTWYRVTLNGAVDLTTRHRGDAIRRLQRLAFLASGA